MPIPAILGIIATGVATYGAKKLYDAVMDDDDDDYDSDDDSELRELEIRLEKEQKKFESSKKRFYAGLSDVITDIRNFVAENYEQDDYFNTKDLCVSIDEFDSDYFLKFKNPNKDLPKIEEWLNKEFDDIKRKVNSNSTNCNQISEIQMDIQKLKDEIANVEKTSL